MQDNIILLDILRIQRNKPRKCTCKIRKFTVDTVNREVTCGCGLIVDPFEALLYLATHYEHINEQHKALDDQRKEWIRQKPHSVIFKHLEQQYRRGKMLPFCPKCDSLFDFKEIKSWGNAEFYRKLQQRFVSKERG